MEIIVEKGFNKKYLFLTKHIKENGLEVDPRGKTTKEISPVTILFQDPLKRIISLPSRNINPFFLVVEILWILSGRDELQTLELFNDNISQFSDDGFFFHAPYGKRLRHFGVSHEFKTITMNSTFRKDEESGLDVMVDFHKEKYEKDIDQLKGVYDLIKKEKNTRRAVAAIWNPIQDLGVDTRDLPCNDLLMFKVRNEKLNLTVLNRSNDLHWGLPTNYFQFSNILEVMSYSLDIEMGEYKHFTDSLHIYLDNPITETILTANKEENIFDIYDLGLQPTKFSLNESYLDMYRSQENKYEKVFSAINDTFNCIENFDISYRDFFLKIKRDASEQELINLFSEHFFDKFSWNLVKTKSSYLYSLLRFSLSYFLYKKAMEIIYDKEVNANLFPFLLRKSMDFLVPVCQTDYKIAGANFYFYLLKKRNSRQDGIPSTNVLAILSCLEFLKNFELSK